MPATEETATVFVGAIKRLFAYDACSEVAVMLTAMRHSPGDLDLL